MSSDRGTREMKHPYTPATRTMATEEVSSSARWDLSSSFSCDVLRLEVVEGPHKGRSFLMEKERALLGRSPLCDLALEKDSKVSSRHCELWLQPGGIHVRDLGSRNGIRMGSCRLIEGVVELGAILELGHSKIKLAQGGRQRDIEQQFSDETQQVIGRGAAMRGVIQDMQRVAASDASVVLTGETGTGKSTIARYIHQRSGRSGLFVEVNCGAIAPNLIESTLFGHEEGAYTDAKERRIGHLEHADGGTLFLDEISELSLELQSKLLTALDKKAVRRLGSNQEIKTNFRLICASNRDLRREVKLGRFRSDLYYRVAVFPMHMPALRDRKEDLPILCRQFLLEFCGDRPFVIQPEAMRKIEGYLWPGNIRELRNALERASLMAEGTETFTLREEHLKLADDVPSSSPRESGAAASSEPLVRCVYEPGSSIKELLLPFERELLLQALEAHSWNVTTAARALGQSRTWLHGRMNKHGLQRSL